MFDIAYEAEANIEAANIILDREWEKAKNLKNPNNQDFYLAVSCFYPSSVFTYWSILFLTHGGY